MGKRKVARFSEGFLVFGLNNKRIYAVKMSSLLKIEVKQNDFNFRYWMFWAICFRSRD